MIETKLVSMDMKGEEFGNHKAKDNLLDDTDT